MPVGTTPKGHRSGRRVPPTGLLVLCLAAGCSTKHKGVGTVSASGQLVDPSWVTATESCWPEVTKDGYSVDAIKRSLAAAGTFRNTFPVYTAQSGDEIDALLAKPVQTAPDPDVSKLTHSSSPVLNRGQAAVGTGPQQAVVQSTHGIAPPDALCAVQTGVPQGFSK